MRLALCIILLGILGCGRGRAAGGDEEEDWKRLAATGELVSVQSIDPTIRVELRYATDRNGAHARLYPPDFPCLVRPEIAARLRLAQAYLHKNGRGLKIWDAYRPPGAQTLLWKRGANRRYVADPTQGRGSLHTWGLAVDVTLVDPAGQELPMPTDFDVFAEGASAIYRGKDPAILGNLHLLQRAMMRVGGFQGLTTEWWHFAVRGWGDYAPLSPRPKAP